MALQEVMVPAHPLARLEPLIGAERAAALEQAAALAREELAGHTVWNVNSTASGGGVAEMLQVLLGYTRGAGLDVRWLVAAGDPEFFRITKRIHNRIHGMAGDDGGLGGAEHRHYDRVTGDNAAALVGSVHAGDIVLLHDPQTAGLVAPLREHGAKVVWRCHIGADEPNEHTREAWSFLLPYIEPADSFVFSRRQHVPEGIDGRAHIIPPSIDPFAPKNRDLGDDDVARIVRSIGVVGGGGRGEPVTFQRRDGTEGHVVHTASIVGGEPLDAALPVVVQVSRWDRLKDMEGVLRGFADGVAGRVDAQLALVGPSTEGVADDPEGAEVLASCTEAWKSLPRAQQDRIRLVSLPMDDVDENAVMVNALQRWSTVVVQKSLAEGFGLTVAEGMWKAKPVVASAVGGIVDQVVPGTGVLLDDPCDLDAFADAVVDLLAEPARVHALGEAARQHVSDAFVGDRHLMAYGALVQQLTS